MLLLCAVAQAHAASPQCVPVMVERPLPLPATRASSGAGCIHYQRVARTAGADAANLLVFGDPQVKSAADVDYFLRDVVVPNQGRKDLAFGVTLGDLTNDVPELLGEVKRVTATLGLPWLHAPGNHDVDPGATSDEASLHAFHKAVGPDTQARQTPLVNLVALDDVILLPGQKPGYIGGLREDQFAFLERWLPTLDKDRLLVVAAHIHLFDEDGKDSFRDADR